MYAASLFISALLLGTTGWFGIALLRRFAPSLWWLERIAYGVPLGAVLASLAMLATACVAGFTRRGVIVFMLLFALGAAVLWPWRLMLERVNQCCESAAARFVDQLSRRRKQQPAAAPRKSGFRRFVPLLVLGLLIIRWALLWPNAIKYEPECLRAGNGALWSDWTGHLSDVCSFAYGNNFPAQHPRFLGRPYGYLYLASITAAAAVKLGADPAYALSAQSFLLSISCALAVYAFARRLTRSSSTATLVVLLFFLGGSLGWVMTLGEMNGSHTFWEVLRQRPWDGAQQERARFIWLNSYFFFIMPQRGFLYGLPLLLLVCTLLLEAVRRDATRLFAMAGATAGLLPFAHLSSMLALAFITPLCALLLWSRRWAWFFATWIAVALPQIYAQQGGGAGPISATKFRLGWLAAPDPWLWFWLKNLGFFIPLLVFASADRTLLPQNTRRFLWACMGIFVATNVAQFQPWDWNNHIILVYWFLAVCILVAAILRKLWRATRSLPLRALLASVVVTMLLSGMLLNLQEWFAHGRHCLLSNEEVMLAKAVRQMTRRSAVFVVGLQNNHPIAVLTGRRVLMSFPGWLWPQGIDASERERDVRAIYAMNAQAPELLRKYKVDYVVIGPEERRALAANRDAFHNQFSMLLRTNNYEIYSTRSGKVAPPAAAASVAR
ncbi:MAG: hypothetical protein ABR526_07100 [Chthoniobacterales bacterium]